MSLDKNYQGTDVNLETSLEEYGFVARPITVDYADEYFVIYKMDDNQYGSGHIRESELDAIVNGTEWASEEDVNSMLETVGASKKEWMDLPFTSKFSDLVSYWGTENIMGTDYYPNDKNWAFEEIGLESDSMDLDDLVDYVVPSHYAYALVNGDYSGLSDEEEQELNEFTETVIERTGNANFIISDNDEGEYFTPANDINNLGSTVRKVYIRPSNSFAWGGESKIPTSMVKKKLIGKTILYNDYQEYVISDVKYAKNGATTLWDYSLYFEDEPNMVIILSQSEMYHLYKIGEVTLNYMAEGSKLRIQSIYQKTNDKINKFYRKIERETNIGFSDEEVEELIADVKSKSNKDGKDYTVYVKDGKLLFDESLSRNLRLDPNKNKIADISPNKRIFRYYADHRLGNGGGVDITSLKKGDVITILGDSYKFLRYETENDEEKTVVLDLKDNSIVSMPKDMVEAYSKYKFAKGGGVDKELYEITLEDIFSFATQSKTTELTDAQYRSILEQKKNGDIVIDRYNQKQGIHEKLRIKSVTKKFADGGGVELNGKKVGVAKRLKIKNWYLKTYPTDDLGKEIKDNLSFWSLYTLMSQRYNVYSVLQVSDSLVRERVFEKLSEILGVKYDYIYKIWLKSSDEYVNGGGIMADGRIVLRDFNGIGGNKNKTYKLIKDDRDSDGKPYYTLIEHPSNKVMAQGDNFEEVNGYADLMSGKFAKGGGVDDADWIEESLIDLQNETGFDDLVVENSDNNHYTASNGNAEFEVFETEDDARERAIERVKEDLEENPEYFSKDWLMNYIDGKDFFTEVYNEWNESYANDIESEDSDKYANRLIEEMVENGIVSSEEAKEDDFDAEDYKDAFVELMTSNQMWEDNGLEHYIDNFGEEQAFKVVSDNNLIDIDKASESAVDTDGVAHFLSSYDGEQIDLSNGHVAYRTN